MVNEQFSVEEIYERELIIAAQLEEEEEENEREALLITPCTAYGTKQNN